MTVVIGVLLFVLQQRTKVGAIVRAGVDNREMAVAVGINIDAVFTGVFLFGALLSGFAGVIGSGLLSLSPSSGTEILLFAMVVVIIGGLGSVTGAAIGAGADRRRGRLREGVAARVLVLHDLRARGTRAGVPAQRAAREARLNRRLLLTRALPLAVVGAAAIALPYVATSYYVVLATLLLSTAVLAASVNMLAGDVGLFSLGHAGIAAACRLRPAWSSRQGLDLPLQLLVAAGLTVLTSVLYGLISMRTSGVFFLMVTLAAGMVCFGIAYRWSSVTGGDNGLTGIRRPALLAEYWQNYFFVLVVFVLLTLAMRRVGRSPFGLAPARHP